jgi:CO/xanthine dehydrogenase Mo-binding subunit
MTGAQIEHEVSLADCLTWVREHSDWDRKRADFADQPKDALRRRGLGVAAYFHGSGLGGEGEDFAYATLSIESDYGIQLTSGLTDYGQGSRTVFTLLAAEVLGVEMDRLHMPRPDTYTTIDSGPTVASRASIVGGNAVRVAAEKLDHELRLAAADLCACAPAQIVRSGELYIGPDEEPRAFEDVVDHARSQGFQLATEARWQIPHIEWDFEHGTGTPYFAYVFGAQVVEVEVNRRTGRTKVTGIWAAHDGGSILFPNGARGQMYGAITQGLGLALMENFRYDQGMPQTRDLRTYRIPRAMDLPEIEGTFIQTHLAEGPFGAKNMGEPLMLAAAPAIANAVFHATGVRVHRLPIDPNALKDADM